MGLLPMVGGGPAANSLYPAVLRNESVTGVPIKLALLLLLLRRKNLLNPESIDYSATRNKQEGYGDVIE
jgi:hypothetical protein